MITYPMHYSDNGHSWSRILMLYRVYWPGLKLGFLIYAILPMVIVFVFSFITNITGKAGLSTLSLLLNILLYLSPIMLTRRDYRDISAQLPVTAVEKLGFLLLTFWIILPAILCLSAAAGEWIGIGVFGAQLEEIFKEYEFSKISVYQEFGLNWTIGNGIFVYITMISMITIVLYYVVKAKKNRVFAAIATIFVVKIALGVFAGVGGMIIGIVAGYQGAASELSETVITQSMHHYMIWVVISTLVIMSLLGAIFLVKLYKRLRNSGF